jgi:hypothetical protein
MEASSTNEGAKMNTKPTAIHAYLTRAAAIHIKLARLQQLADDHFGHDPEAIHWGHVGDLGRVDQALDDLLAIFDGQAQ